MTKVHPRFMAVLVLILMPIGGYWLSQNLGLSEADQIERKRKCALCDLHKLDLSHRNFFGVDFQGANLIEADLSNSDLRHANLFGADLRKSKINGLKLKDAIWVNGKKCLDGSVGKCLTVEIKQLIKTGYCKKCDLRAATLPKEISYEKVDLRYANLSRAFLSGTVLTGADLSHANLSGADLFQADLTGAYFYKADLSGADLLDANLTRANLQSTQLTRANLSRADLTQVDLKNAILHKASLAGAKLNGANLANVNLLGADITGVDFGDAYLKSVKGLDLKKVDP
jgi:uncharacterized protein YjbI with pentapeptide repeats